MRLGVLVADSTPEEVRRWLVRSRFSVPSNRAPGKPPRALLDPDSICPARCYTAPETSTHHRELPLHDAADVARRIVDLLADRQAQDIVLLDISRVAAFADYFVIASAVSPRQMDALVDILAKELGRDGVDPLRREGAIDSGWLLLDYGAVIVHLFSPELREYYELEELWRAATPVVRVP